MVGSGTASVATLALTLLAALATPLGAQDVTVRSYLSENPVPPGLPFDLNVEIAGAQGLDSDPVLPDMDAFANLISTGRTSSMRVVSGVTTVTTTLVYRFLPTATGTFEIGPVYVSVGGQTLSTEPLSLSVGGDAPPPDQPGAGAPPPSTGTRPPDDRPVSEEDIFITADVSDRQVFTGEPVIVEYRIWTRVNVSQYSITELPANTGFWVEEFPLPSPEVEQVTRDGVPFATAVIRKVALFPTGPGRRTVEPLGLEAQIRVRRRSDNVLDDFFNRSLLGRLEAVMVRSDPVEIQVDPLPDGQSRDFTGFVGSIDVSANLDRAEVETNAALSLELRVRAVGNVQTLPPPDIAFPPDFEVYPPEVTERIDRTGSGVRGTRTYQYVLIPRVPGSHTIPSVTMEYFDPAQRAYRVARTDPLAVEVSGLATEDALVVRPSRGGIQPLREDIRFISIEVPRFRRSGGALHRSAAFWIVLLLPLAALGGALGVRRHQDRLAGDVAWARGRRAGRTARKRLARARSLLDDQGPALHAEVGRALQGFLGDRLNLAEAGMMTEDVRARLAMRGVSDDAIEAYLSCLDECDRQRFSPGKTTRQEREALVARAEEAMTRVDREVRR